MAEDITAVDFFRDDRLTDDPYPFYAALRDKCPVTREKFYGVTMVTGWQEAVEVYNDAESFSSCISVTGPFPGFPVSLEGKENEDITELINEHRDEIPFSDQLPTLDPPTHTNHRALLMRLITPKRLKENEDAMWQIADDILDDFLAPGHGEFINGFAGPFTLRVIADLLGVPEEDRPEFMAALGAERPDGTRVGSLNGEPVGLDPLQYLDDKFAGYLAERRREPRGDVLSGMATALYPDGSTPELIEVVKPATFLFAAGQETVTKLLSAAVQTLGDYPEYQQLLREQPEKIGVFIEEALRMQSPTKVDFRLVRKTTTLGGVPLKAGTIVMLCLGAANRDPRKFDNPHEFRLDRKNVREHVAFGRGIHSCAGAPLARVEGQITVRRLLDRISDIRISESAHGPAGQRRYSYEPTFLLRGLTELNIEFTAGG